MNNGAANEASEKKGYRILILLLVALAALSSAMKDLERLQAFTGELQEYAARWTDQSMFAVSAAVVTGDESWCAESPEQDTNQQQFRWNKVIAAGKSIEIKGISGDIVAEPSTGTEVEVVANKHSRRSDVNTVNIKVIEHEGGVTICAVYPTDDPNRTTGCELGRPNLDSLPAADDTQPERSSVNVRSEDVQVDFKIRIPAGVHFLGRTINGEIVAESLSGNVFCRTVNGSIRLSTSGYGEAKTVNGEILAKLGSAEWTGSLQFKTVNGEIKIELPPGVGANVTASTFNGEITSDFPLTVSGKFSKRQLSGTIGGGGRELLLKTLNGSINLKRAG